MLRSHRKRMSCFAFFCRSPDYSKKQVYKTDVKNFQHQQNKKVNSYFYMVVLITEFLRKFKTFLGLNLVLNRDESIFPSFARLFNLVF